MCLLNSGPSVKFINVVNQSFFESDNTGYPPHTLCHKDLLSSSGVRYNLLGGVYNNVVVVLEGNSHSYSNTSKLRGCRYTKLIDSTYRYSRYWYHQNAIINKDISPLVGIVFLSRCSSLSSSLPEQCDLFIVPQPSYSNWNYD
jgi:hypothetical protein